MEIVNVHRSYAPSSSCVFLVSDTENSLDLSCNARKIEVVSSLRGVQASSASELIVVGAPIGRLDEVFGEWLESGQRIAQWWLEINSRSQFHNPIVHDFYETNHMQPEVRLLEDAMLTWNHLAIDGVAWDGRTLKLGLVKRKLTNSLDLDISSQLLISLMNDSGLTNRGEIHEPATNFAPSRSLKGQIIMAVASCLKPLKQRLPKKVVATLYKILDMIR